MDTRRVASLIAANVVPAVPLVRAESFSTAATTSAINLGNFDVSFDPTTVDIQAAAGGYGAVLEFSPQFCLQTAFADLALTPVYIPLDYWDCKAFFQKNFSSLTIALQAFYSNIDWSKAPDIELAFVPLLLQFPTKDSVTITITVRATLLALQTLATVQGSGGGGGTPTGGGNGGTAGTVSVPFLLGNLTMTISAPFSAVPHASFLGADVTGQLMPPPHKGVGPHAAIKISVSAAPGQDVAVFLTQGLLGPNGEDVMNVLAGKSAFRLVPSLSLLGLEPVNSQGVNMPEFHVDAVALAGESFPVLAVGFNLKTACSGSPNNIQQFIGSFDFGTITDEFAIETVFKHKWNLPGKFERTLPLFAPISVSVNNQQQDATLEGTLQLNTLDVVSIDADANARTDVLHLQVTSVVAVNDIRLQDGTVLGPNQVDFGPPGQLPWSFGSALAIDAAFDSRPALRNFEKTAYNGAYNYISRPFANLADPTAVSPYYSRVDAVVHRVYTVSFIETDFPFV